MERVLIFSIIIISLCAVLFLVLSSDAVEGYIKSVIISKIQTINENPSIEIKYGDIDTGFISSTLKKVSIIQGSNSLTSDRIVIRPDYYRSIISFDIVVRVSLYHNAAVLEVDPENISLSAEVAGISGLDLFDTDINLTFKGSAARYGSIKLEDSILSIRPGDFSTDFLKLDSGNISFNVRKAGRYFGGELSVKDASCKEYEAFLRDFPGMTYKKGLFSAELELSFKDGEPSYDGSIFMENALIQLEDIGVTFSFSGKVSVEDDVRTFSENPVHVFGKKLLLTGVRVKGDSLDLNLKQENKPENRIRIFGRDNDVSYSGKWVAGGTEFSLSGKEFIKLTVDSDKVSGMIFVEREEEEGNFRFSMLEDVKLWGNLKLDIAERSLRSVRSFIRLGKNILPFSLRIDKKFKFSVDRYLSMVFDYKNGSMEVDVASPVFKDKIRGKLELGEGILDIQGEGGYFRTEDITDISLYEIDYRFDIPALEVAGIGLEGIHAAIRSDEDKLVADGSIEAADIGGIKYESLNFEFFPFERSAQITGGDFGAYLQYDEKGMSGEISGIKFRKKVTDELGMSFEIHKAFLCREDETVHIRPESASMKINDQIYHYMSGSISLADNILFTERIIFASDKDTAELIFNYDGELDYEMSLKGNGKMIFRGLGIENKVLRVKGSGDTYSGYVIIDKASAEMLEQELLISGKIEFNSKEFKVDALKVIRDDNEFFCTGEFSHDLTFFDFRIFTGTTQKIFMEHKILDFEGNIEGELYLSSAGEKVKVSCDLNSDKAYLNIKRLDPEGEGIIPGKIRISSENTGVKYMSNSFELSGDIEIGEDLDKNKIDIVIDTGRVDIFGNDFRVERGTVSTLRINSLMSKKMVDIQNKGERLDTRYSVTDRESHFSETDTDNISETVWIDLLLSRNMNDYKIFANVKGTPAEKTIFFYSEPELEINEIYEMLKNNSIFSFFEARDSKERFFNVLGANRNIIKRFTKSLNFDTFDFNRVEGDYNLKIGKEVNENLFFNYEKGVFDEQDDSFGFKYQFNRQLQLETEKNERDNYLRLRWKLNF